jgi:2-oxoglutarate ferredoxin oxidoreductase subunit alpha
MKEPVITWTPEPKDENEGHDWRIAGAKGRIGRILKSLFLSEGSLAKHNLMLKDKYEDMASCTQKEEYHTEDAELIVVAYGSIGRIVKSTIKKLRNEGHKVGLFRPITLYPFPSDDLKKLAEQGKKFLTIEHNLGQMVEDVRLSIRTITDSDFFGFYPGNLPTPDDFEEPILKALGGK